MLSLSRRNASTQRSYRSTGPRRTLALEALEDRMVLSYTYTTIDPPGSVLTQAIGINDSNQIVGAYRLAGGSDHGFLLSGGTYTTFDFPGNITSAYAINNTGQIVGAYQLTGNTNATPQHGFLLSGGAFTSIDVPGATQTLATGINDAGQIVGQYNDATGTHGFLLNGGVFTTINVPGETGTIAYWPCQNPLA